MELRLAFCTVMMLAGLAACGGGNDTPPPLPPTDPFAAVDAEARSAFDAQGIDGMGVAVFDAQGVKRFERMYGDFSPDRRIAIASASKLVSGLTLLRLVDQGYLSLESTTGAVLGWTGPNGAITLRQLLSFTSGLPPDAACAYEQFISLAECVDEVAEMPPVAAPGSRFDYGSTHLHVAARMAEVVTGQSWAEVFSAQLRTPLGIGADMAYYSAPRIGVGTSNPLIAGGLRATMNEYARVLRLEFHRGTFDGSRMIADALFTAQGTEPFPDAVIGNSPLAALDRNFHYGLGAWLECPPPAVDCAVVSSPGAFGFTPWVDRDAGYYAMIAMEVDRSQDGVVAFSVDLAQRLKPLIREALAR